eukprot:6197119-Pleurochrysis_carterae.AAC.2
MDFSLVAVASSSMTREPTSTAGVLSATPPGNGEKSSALSRTATTSAAESSTYTGEQASPARARRDRDARGERLAFWLKFQGNAFGLETTASIRSIKEHAGGDGWGGMRLAQFAVDSFRARRCVCIGRAKLRLTAVLKIDRVRWVRHAGLVADKVGLGGVRVTPAPFSTHSLAALERAQDLGAEGIGAQHAAAHRRSLVGAGRADVADRPVADEEGLLTLVDVRVIRLVADLRQPPTPPRGP